MKCGHMVGTWHFHACGKPAKWWYRHHPDGNWTPRCGRHALLPGNTLRTRIPITEPRPGEGHEIGAKP